MLILLPFGLASYCEGLILDLQSGGIAVARTLLVKLYAASTGWLLEGAFLLCLPAVFAAGGWLPAVYHDVVDQENPGYE